ncbi:unnamed protein product [Prorocentrum cordatum]|uniref:Uncharacterized protein n=1 Tax=Prorocentrum cordatum TaxID=2364126 RepID=A0ABN9VRK7_9DINO|nr:unnamed protein product [Polarella glacialis]
MTRLVEAFREAGIQRFLDVQRFCEAPPHRLRVSELGPLYGLRYRRGESDFRSPLVRQARGIVLEKETNQSDRVLGLRQVLRVRRGRAVLRRAAEPSPVGGGPPGEIRAQVRRGADQGGPPGRGEPPGLHERHHRRGSGSEMRGPGGRFGFSGDDGDPGAAGPGGLGAASAAGPPGGPAPASLRQAFAEAGGLALPYEERASATLSSCFTQVCRLSYPHRRRPWCTRCRNNPETERGFRGAAGPGAHGRQWCRASGRGGAVFLVWRVPRCCPSAALG